MVCNAMDVFLTMPITVFQFKSLTMSLIVLTVIAVALTWLGLIGFKRRVLVKIRYYMNLILIEGL